MSKAQWIGLLVGVVVGFIGRELVQALYPRRHDELLSEYLRREYGGKDEPNPDPKRGSGA